MSESPHSKLWGIRGAKSRIFVALEFSLQRLKTLRGILAIIGDHQAGATWSAGLAKSEPPKSWIVSANCLKRQGGE